MLVDGKPFRTIWLKNDNTVQVIDQRFLPFKFVVEDLNSLEDVFIAIKDMHVRGAPLIGAAAAYGMFLAAVQGKEEALDSILKKAAEKLISSRPTAINLEWAVKRQLDTIKNIAGKENIIKAVKETADQIVEEDVSFCKKIGEHGVELIKEISQQKKTTVNILTHCNAGWLATVDYGTATSPIYKAQELGLDIHVWVDETRPRNQGAKLTAWELQEQGIPHTVIADNTGGHLMQHDQVDLILVGSDRTSFTGDVANKIGTYLKALAAKDNNIPFYVALPSSTIDWTIRDGIKEIPIETRSPEEVKFMEGLGPEGDIQKVQITPTESPVINYGFDVTPARLVTGLITERGICEAREDKIKALFPEKINH